MIFLDFLKVKKFEKMLQNTPDCTIQKKNSGKHAPEPPNKRSRASQAPPPTKKKLVGPPWQILHTPMNCY